MLLGSMLAFFLQMLGHILSVTTRLLQLMEMLRFILLAEVRIRSFWYWYQGTTNLFIWLRVFT